MRIIELPIIWTIIIDFAAWFVIHMVTAIFTLKLPDQVFAHDSWLYRCRSWENSGRIWDKLFKVKAWKDNLPDGAAILKQGFSKKELQEADAGYFERFVLESRRAELTHYLAIPPAFLFFLWNPLWVSVFMIFYALAANAPCVLAQRYNRPRFMRAAKRLKANSAAAASNQPANGFQI